VNCLICGGTAARLVVRAPDFEYRCRHGEWNLVECTACGHICIDPVPAVEEVAALYPPGYYTVNARSPISMNGPVVEAKMAKDARALRRRLGSRVIRSVVDIGGGNLSRLIKLRDVFQQEAGAPVTAACLDLQFEATALREAEAVGIRCLSGNVETDLSALDDEGYDLVILRQLLEHLRDPRAALVQLRRKLAPQGVLVVETPNRGGWDYRLFKSRYWGGYHIPRHFHLFNLASLARLLGETGYRAEWQGCTPSIAFWIISLRNMLGLNSIERGRSLGEFLNLKNLPVVGGFYVLDLLWLAVGGQTSNQVVVATPASPPSAGR